MKRFLLILFLQGVFLSVFTSLVLAAPSLNEFLVHPSSGNSEWVEMYNPDGIDISSYWLDDDTNFSSDTGSSNKKALTSLLPSPTQLYSYLTFSSFLNDGGDYVVLFDSAGVIIDQYNYTSDPGVDVVTARVPDGTGSWSTNVSSTQGLANPTSTPTPSPTPTPTPTPSSTPSPSPTPSQTSTPKPTVKPTATPTLTPTPSPTPTAEETSENDLVLGTSADQTPEPTITPAPKTGVFSSGTPIAIGMIAGGVGCLGFAGYSFIRGRKQKTNFGNFDKIDSSHEID